MKKILVLLGLFLTMVSASAQEVLIPYKKGNLFGLVNEKGEFEVQPQYREMEWLLGKYFLTTNPMEINSQLPINSPRLALRSLYFGATELIKPQAFLGFNVLPEMMIAAKYQDLPAGTDGDKLFKNTPGSFSLFNRKGEVVLQDLKRLEYIDTIGSSNRGNNVAPYALMYCLDYQQNHGIFMLDTDSGKIKEWLIEKVSDLSIQESKVQAKTYFLSYKDSNQVIQSKKLFKSNGYYRIEDLDPKEKEQDKRKPNQTLDPTQQLGEIRPLSDLDEEERAKYSPSFIHRYLFVEGEIIFETAEGTTSEIKLKNGAQPIFMDKDFKKQTQSLIYKQNNKFGIVSNGKIEKPIYDSLAYLGADYLLVGKKQEGKLKFGTVDLSGKEIIPIQYDSIFGKAKDYVFVADEKTKKEKLIQKSSKGKFYNEPKNPSHFVGANKQIWVYKDGKVGILNLNNEVVLPIEYDEIGDNLIRPFGSRTTRYMVLKKDGLYGVILLNYDSETKQTYQETIEPLFPYYPAYYFNNYYDIKGYKLFVLYDEYGQVMTYASEMGKLYME